jgi:AraC-like DNA-binding protein
MLTHPEVARALEQALLHAMITCLTGGRPVETCPRIHHHSRVIARFEEFLAANHNRSLHLVEICTAIGVSARTLQVCCNDVLGMGPMRYLWLRRMHLARRAFLLADPTTATVTAIVTEFGFWELGRFSVAYRALFGESSLASLRRPREDPGARQDDPFALPAAQFA